MAERWKQADELRVHVKDLNFAAEEYQHRDGERTSYRTFLLGYLLILSLAIGAGVMARRWFGADPFAVGFTILGVVYLLAAWQRPRIIYLILRQTNWFGYVRDPLWLRRLMLAIGVLLLVLGLFFPVGDIIRHR